jgi:hypothetical protein
VLVDDLISSSIEMTARVHPLGLSSPLGSPAPARMQQVSGALTTTMSDDAATARPARRP